MPVHKEPGNQVFAGTINKNGTFTFRATRVGADTVLARIINMVEEAQAGKPPIQQLAAVRPGRRLEEGVESGAAHQLHGGDRP